MLDIPYMFPGKINVYVDEAFVPPAGRRSQLSLGSHNGANYYHPIARIMSVIVKGRPDGRESKVKLKLLKVVQVNLVVVETFEEFFMSNVIDPEAVEGEFENLLPPDYTATYDPSKGAIVKQNRFVRNIASVLRINPERIKVTNIVPGNGRRRLHEL